MYKIIVLGGNRKWWWRLTSSNGKILAHSETYNRKQSAIKTAKKLQNNLKYSELEIRGAL